MPHLKYSVSKWVLALAVSAGLSAALSTPSRAASVYTFTFTDTNAQDNAGDVEFNLNGSFSIPVSDFAGDPASLSNADMVALSFLGVSHATYYNTNPGSSSFATADIFAGGGAKMFFTYVGGIPQVDVGNGDFAHNPDGQFLNVGCCNTLFSWQGSHSESSVGVAGNWATTVSDVSATPLPAALPMFASGLGALSLLGWRKRHKNRAARAAA